MRRGSAKHQAHDRLPLSAPGDLLPAVVVLGVWIRQGALVTAAPPDNRSVPACTCTPVSHRKAVMSGMPVAMD